MAPTRCGDPDEPDTSTTGTGCRARSAGAALRPTNDITKSTWDFGRPAVSLSPPTHPGLHRQCHLEDTDATQVRMFGNRPIITFKMTTDGLSNTLLSARPCPTSCKVAAATGPGPRPGSDDHIPLNYFTDYFDDADGCTAAPLRYYANSNVASGFKSRHPGGVHFALADGSVRFLKQTIDHQLYQYLGCRDDAQPVSLP